MHYFKKVFFLILLAGLIIAPQAAKAETANITNISISPTSIFVPIGGGQIRFSLHTTNAATKDEAVTNGSHIIINLTPNKGLVKKVSKDTDTELPNGAIGVAYFDVLYTPPAPGQAQAGDFISLKVDINDTQLRATVTASISLITAKAGDSCDSAQEDSCGADTGLECEKETGTNRGYCVPEQKNRNIGTWCKKVGHCKTPEGGFELTCDDDENRCVGAVTDVLCMDNDINQNPVWGDTAADQLDSSDRCDTGLYCDPNKGSCQNDFGQAKIPSDKLGQAAEDIRDQIRNIINIALGFLGVAGVIVVIYGGVLWMSATGDDEKVGKAKKTIISGMIGLVIIGVAWTIVSYVLTITQGIS